MTITRTRHPIESSREASAYALDRAVGLVGYIANDATEDDPPLLELVELATAWAKLARTLR